MHDQIEAALDVMARHLGGPSGYDGRWRWTSRQSGEPVEIYLMLQDGGRVSLHVDARACPVKFADITCIEQLEGLLGHILPLCR